MALPLLPGYSFNKNIGKEKYHKSHYFDSKNEVNFMFGDDKIGIGGQPLPGQRIDAPTSKYPSGEGDRQPAWIAFDKQVLFFDAYFQESVNERREENFRIRNCKILFYLEDDTIQIIEPRTKNSCLPQGTIIRRHRIHRPLPNDHLFYTVHDFNVGIELEIYGRIFRIISCDEFTHNFLRKLGVKVGSPEKVPQDNYNQTRKAMNEAMQPLRPYERRDKLKQFLDHDRQVLRFYCYWDDSDNLYGDRREMILHYFLADDTIEIREVILPNGGRDAASTFLRRQKLPKNVGGLPEVGTVTERTLLNVLGHPQRGGRYMIDSLKTGQYQLDYYTDKDLRIGASVNVYGRHFVLTDMDTFTKEYYNSQYGMTNFTAMATQKYLGEPINKIEPPFNGWGSEEDSLGNCHGLIPQPPKRDFMKFMEKDRQGLVSNILRFKARLVTSKDLDKSRRFIISFFLSDDSILVYEQIGKNSGFLGGKFLERGKIKKPNQERYGVKMPEFYSAGDLHIGAIVEINNFNFFIEDADEYAYRYMELNAYEYPQSNIDRVLLKLRNKLGGKEEELRSQFQQMDPSNCGTINFQALCNLIRQYFAEQELTDHEICTIARHFANRPLREVNVSALLGIVQQNLRKVNFDDFQKMKETFVKEDRRGDGYFHRNHLYGICKVFHVPVAQDLLHMVFDICRSEVSSDMIHGETFLNYIDWRKNPHTAPVSEQEIFTDHASLNKGKLVEDINYGVLISQIFEN